MSKLYVLFSTTPIEPQRGQTLLEATHRPFKSGADGYFIGGKVDLDDGSGLHQVSCNVIRIGSKDEDSAIERMETALTLEATKLEARGKVKAAKERIAAARAMLTSGQSVSNGNGHDATAGE